MKIQNGIDLIEIERIKNSLRRPRFLARVFSKEEIAFFETRHFAAETIAASFAAKEAFSKALGTGFVGFDLREVSVLRDEQGAPYLSFTGKAKALVESKHLSFALSLTHTRSLAAAVVTAISLPGKE